jgi:uncharacterized Zn finger protein
VSRRGWDGDYPPRAKPRRAADGIKAQTKRGAFGSGWWAKRWIGVLEGFSLGARLTRGRSYARSGQVTQIALETGGVRAQVQGSRAKPYDVTIRMRELSAAQWRAVGTAITNNVRLAAALLAGEMPEDIETAFATAGVTLFPASAKELKTACSCPDWSNPCKHLAAVFYLVGEEFDRDPVLLFVVRGLAREAVRDLFAAPPATATSESATTSADASETTAPDVPARRPRSVPIAADAFWGSPLRAVAGSEPRLRASAPGDAALLKRAGRFPFWRDDVPLEEAVAPIYRDAANAALEWLADRADRS